MAACYHGATPDESGETYQPGQQRLNNKLSVLGKCLADSTGGGTGTKLVILTCNGQASQTWSHRSNGEYVLALNGLCLTDPSGSSVNGTQVQLRTCQNFKDQRWSLP